MRSFKVAPARLLCPGPPAARAGYYPPFFYPAIGRIAKSFIPQFTTAYYIKVGGQGCKLRDLGCQESAGKPA
jgi:hypothetical protein